MKQAILSLLFMIGHVHGQITVVTGNSYDAINPIVRTYGLWYDASKNFQTMPIAVFVHGGAWSGGTAYGLNTIAPNSCSGAEVNAVMCGLASAGYAAYSINYTLATSDPATKWPTQWQDAECFLKFLAEEGGSSSVPGNPQSIHLFGHSAGAQLVGVTAFAPHATFTANCSHTSTAYTVKAAALLSPPLDLRAMWIGGDVQGGISGLLGCTPQAITQTSCVELAASANPITYLSPSTSIPIMVETGMGDQNIAVQYQSMLQSTMAGFNPPTVVPWNVFPSTFAHDLDLFYYNPCSSDPDKGAEPSPCGVAGRSYSNLLSFFQANL